MVSRLTGDNRDAYRSPCFCRMPPRARPRRLPGTEIATGFAEEPLRVEADADQLGCVLDDLINKGLTYCYRMLASRRGLALASRRGLALAWRRGSLLVAWCPCPGTLDR